MRRVLLALLSVSVTTVGCSGPAPEVPGAAAVPTRPAAAPLEDYPNRFIEAEREEFYHLSEGGESLPLAILRALERPRTPQDPEGDGAVPFTQNLERYGFIPDGTSSQNPFGLPTGMTVARSRLTN